MTRPGDALPRLEWGELTPGLQDLLGPRVERLGYLGEFFRVTAVQPDALAAFVEFTEALKRALPEELTEVIALSLAARTGNAYERHQHERLCLALGLERGWIADVLSLSPTAATRLTDRERAVQALSLAIVDSLDRGGHPRGRRSARRGRRHARSRRGRRGPADRRPLPRALGGGPNPPARPPGRLATRLHDMNGHDMNGRDVSDPRWLTEADVVSLLDLPTAMAAIEAAFAAEAADAAFPLDKTHVGFAHGHGLHALGGVLEPAGVAGTKTWVHTGGGASPLLVLFDTADGRLLAVVEAFALGQLRTGAVSGIATARLARPDAAVLAVVGAGRQALAQVAAVVAACSISQVRVFSPRAESREALAQRVDAELGVAAVAVSTVEDADRVRGRRHTRDARRPNRSSAANISRPARMSMPSVRSPSSAPNSSPGSSRAATSWSATA